MSDAARRRFLELARGFISPPVRPALWWPPRVAPPENFPVDSAAAENGTENQAENRAENSAENLTSPWFATRRPLALPPANSGRREPADAEPESDGFGLSRWFG